jgi:hypothetical protein
MTDRLKGAWVAFDADIREDDAEALIEAIKQLRHVQAVEPSVSDPEDWMARERVRRELGEKLWAVLEDDGDGSPWFGYGELVACELGVAG